MSALGAGIKVAELAFGASIFEKFVGIDGLEGVTSQLLSLIPKIAVKAAHLDHAALNDMLDLMHARVPRDSGLLYSGIEGHFEGETGVVTASAQKTSPSGKLGADYAPFVEHGTKPHAVADEAYFASSGGHRPSRATTGHPGTPAQPFFFNSALEALHRHHGQVVEATNGAIAETGMGE